MAFKKITDYSQEIKRDGLTAMPTQTIKEYGDVLPTQSIKQYGPGALPTQSIKQYGQEALPTQNIKQYGQEALPTQNIKQYGQEALPTQGIAQFAKNQGTDNYRYNADDDPLWQAAKQKVTDTEAGKPTYEGTYEDLLKNLFDKVMNREAFSYDLNGDALWQQYKDQYTTQGQLAMMDTMGQAAALTGGYGSSYSQSAGQQAYQGYLQQLNDRIPELYQLALDKYNSDYALLKDQFSTTAQMRDDEYGRYMDNMGQYNTDLDRARSDADKAYDRGYTSWLTGEQLRRDDDNTAYSRQQDSYDKLASLISSTGYKPTQEELEAAGMSPEQAAAYAKAYKGSKKTTTKVVYKDKEGKKVTYDSIVDDLNESVRRGDSKSEISADIKAARDDGYITAAEAKKLLDMFCPRGQTY